MTGSKGTESSLLTAGAFHDRSNQFFSHFSPDHLRFWWNLVYRVILGPEHVSDSFTSLRVIVSALFRAKLWILYVADHSLLPLKRIIPITKLIHHSTHNEPKNHIAISKNQISFFSLIWPLNPFFVGLAWPLGQFFYFVIFFVSIIFLFRFYFLKIMFDSLWSDRKKLEWSSFNKCPFFALQ